MKSCKKQGYTRAVYPPENYILRPFLISLTMVSIALIVGAVFSIYRVNRIVPTNTIIVDISTMSQVDNKDSLLKDARIVSSNK